MPAKSKPANPKNNYAMPLGLQKLVLLAAAVAAASLVFGALISAFLTPPFYEDSAHSLRQLWATLVIFVPLLLLFLPAYFLNPKKLSRTAKLVETLVITAVAVLLIGVLTDLVLEIVPVLFAPEASAVPAYQRAYNLVWFVAPGGGYLMYLAMLIYLRLSKRWR